MNKRFWKGFFLIIIFYTCYYLLFLDASYILNIPRKIRHLIKFISLVSVYSVGRFHLATIDTYWMKTIWNIIHISGIGIICAFGLYDMAFGVLPIEIRWVLDSVAEFLIAPSLYVVMGLVQEFVLKKEKDF